MQQEFDEGKFIFGITDLEMSIRSSSRANKGKNPMREVGDNLGLRKEPSITPASTTLSPPPTIVPLGPATQQLLQKELPFANELLGTPIGRDPATSRIEFSPGPSLHEGGHDLPLSVGTDDDEAPSVASSEDVIEILHQKPITPGYTVQTTLKMEGIKKDCSQMHLVKVGGDFPLLTVSKAIHTKAFEQARSIGHNSCALIDLEAEVSYINQAKTHALKTTFDDLELSSWDNVVTSIAVLHEQDPKRQIRVNLIYSYRPKALEVTDCLPATILSIKRGAESVVVHGDSPTKKKGKSTTIDQYTTAQAGSATARAILAAETRQLQFEHEGKNHVREILRLYHCQLSKCDNPGKICIHKGGRHFMFSRELPRLWSDAIVAEEATLLSIPVNLLHLLTIDEPGDIRRRGKQVAEPGPSTTSPMPQFIIMPPPQYQLPPMPPQ